MKRSLITGITGQDESFLVEFLLERGCEVCGLARRESWFRPNNVSHAKLLNVDRMRALGWQSETSLRAKAVA